VNVNGLIIPKYNHQNHTGYVLDSSGVLTMGTICKNIAVSVAKLGDIFPEVVTSFLPGAEGYINNGLHNAGHDISNISFAKFQSLFYGDPQSGDENNKRNWRSYVGQWFQMQSAGFALILAVEEKRKYHQESLCRMKTLTER